MVRYIRKAGLDGAIRAHDWARFARGYNGPAYKKYRYDTKIAAAYRRFSKIKFEDGPDKPTPKGLRRGSKGEAVANLQRNLSAIGYPLRIDGDFGPATVAAVRKFQRDRKLGQTGIADARTLEALGRAMPFSNSGWSLLTWLKRMVSAKSRTQ